jgi:hypothetical protein
MGRTAQTLHSQPPAQAATVRPPRWEDVIEVIEDLVRTGAVLPTSVGLSSKLATYQRGRRIMVDSEAGSHWVAVDDIHECWKTFERLGRIRRQDVLEPGRCSAFVMALFARVPGVVERTHAEHFLVLLHDPSGLDPG